MLKRLENIKVHARKMEHKEEKNIIKNMTNEELQELANDNTTEKRINEIWERAKNEYKSKIAKKA